MMVVFLLIQVFNLIIFTEDIRLWKNLYPLWLLKNSAKPIKYKLHLKTMESILRKQLYVQLALNRQLNMPLGIIPMLRIIISQSLTIYILLTVLEAVTHSTADLFIHF